MERERLIGLLGDAEIRAVYRDVDASGDLCGFYNQYHADVKVQVARNALWALTKASDEELVQLQPMLCRLIANAMQAENSSIRRLTLHLIDRLKIEEADLTTDFLDFCLDHMARMDEPPGVQSLCMKLAHKMCSFYPELTDEFIRTLQAMDIEYYTAGVTSVRRKILKAHRRR